MRRFPLVSRRTSGTASLRFTAAAACAVLLLIAAGILWLRLPSTIGVLRPSSLPIALAGTTPEPAMSEALAEAAEQSRENAAPADWMWSACVDAVAVLSYPVEPGADYQWRRDVIDGWAKASGWDHGVYKEGGDALYPRGSQDFQLKVLPLASERDDMTPFEREMMNAHPEKLLVIAMEYECPDPHPAWKDSVRAALSLIGVR